MCGIAGILSLDGAPVARETIDAMNRSLAHRGPNDEGVLCEGPVGLGARRLSIFDLSKAGHQPMVSADGRYVLSYNGEIYNWPEIRAQLAFDDWRSKGDTETLLQAFVERGPECLSMFNGMFAIAIWDRAERSLFLARDRVGIKPLFIAQHGSRFMFASEAKALFAAGHPIEANEVAIYDFLRWGLVDHDEKSFYANIEHLPPAHWLRISADGTRELARYWDIVDVVASQPTITAAEATDLYGEGLRRAIGMYCRSDVPVAAFLSSGVDSSILISFMAEAGLANLCSFTFDFDTGNVGERIDAKKTADFGGVEHDYAILRHAEVPEVYDRVLYHQEYPVTSMRVLAHFKLYERARDRGYTVILDGNGGDQTGGGFEYYWLPAVMDAMMREGYAAAFERFNDFMDLYKIPQENRLERLLGCISANLTPGVCTQDGVPFANPTFLSAGFRERHRDRYPTYVRPFDTHVLNAQHIDLTYHNQKRVLRMSDRCSMGMSLEQRVPVLDHELIELGFRTEHEGRVRGTEQRYYMREAARRLLPPEILRRPKRSIVDPQRQWLKDELREWVGDLFNSQSFADLDILDAKAVREEYDRYCAIDGIPPSGFHIFQFVNVGQWYARAVKGEMFTDVGTTADPYSMSAGMAKGAA